MATVQVALTIAGSDSGGGAGIQADLKAFARCGVHGTSAITAITAQNTVAVDLVHPVPPAVIRAQIAAVASDLRPAAVKVGMLGDAATVAAVAGAIADLLDGVPIVVDPVMVAESGANLLEPDARQALVEEILPLATVLTPNLAEARLLAATGDGDGATQSELARTIAGLGPASVIVTGGHTDAGADLLLLPDGRTVAIAGRRHPDGAAHGSGCTHSSSLAACLARGYGTEDAARAARSLAAEAVANGLRDLGQGAGPVDVIGLAGGDGGPAGPPLP